MANWIAGLKKQNENSVHDQPRLGRPRRRIGGGGKLADVLVFVPEFCEERPRARVGMRIVAGKLVAESPEAHRQGQTDKRESPRPEHSARKRPS